MPTLLKKPLTWMVLAECVVVGALVIIAWHVLASTASQGVVAAQPYTSGVAAPDAAGTPLPVLPSTRPFGPGPMPGLNLQAGFWRLRLVNINRDEAAFEALEWRLAHTIIESARGYLETVVLPAVRRAELGG